MASDRIAVETGQIVRQKDVSLALDRATLHKLKVDAPIHVQAHLELISSEGSGSWLYAMPSSALGLELKGPSCRIALQRRLRMPIFDEEFFCPMCDDVMDIYGDHALVCPCGGDRTKRHNLLRNSCARFCQSFGLRPEVEKPGLLAERMDDEKLEGETLQDGRRPADVFLPHCDLSGAATLDFAVINGLRGDILRDSASSGLAAATAYEEKTNRI